jgi:hypothetical protein
MVTEAFQYRGKANTVELAEKQRCRRLYDPLPTCGGGLGWGVSGPRKRQLSIQSVGPIFNTTGGVVTLKNTTVALNFASFSNDNIYGTVTDF